MLVQADAFYLPFPSGYFHACVTSPPYWGLRKYAGDQGDEPLGLEKTPERHIRRMVEVFREAWRVTRPDGVVWLNYGDAFDDGNLLMMPHRLAIALQDDGWIVRNDLVWFKRNPMPESVAGWRWERKKIQTGREPADWDALPKGWDVGEGSHDAIGKGNYRDDDGRERTVATYEYGDDYVLRKSSWRHTRAHEYVFQLVKGMGYFCNQEVVREALARPEELERETPAVFGCNDKHDGYGTRKASGNPYTRSSGRNPRSVLDVPTAPYKGAHYATFPPNLIAPLIRASVPRRCCSECGMAWAPVVEKEYRSSTYGDSYIEDVPGSNDQKQGQQEGHYFTERKRLTSNVINYRPTCEHDADPVPGRVLDIFGGSGTTGMVAKELMRSWVVMDISRPYLDEQAKIRTRTGTPSNTLSGLPMFSEES